jgi:hypothetical protein
MTTAQTALEQQIAEAWDLVSALQDKVADYHRKANRGDVTNWGYAGDVEHMNQKLRELLGMEG